MNKTPTHVPTYREEKSIMKIELNEKDVRGEALGSFLFALVVFITLTTGALSVISGLGGAWVVFNAVLACNVCAVLMLGTGAFQITRTKK